MFNRIRNYSFEVCVILSIAVLYVIFISCNIVSLSEIQSAWYIPFIGILAASIAMSTPAGGGIVFFPVMLLLGTSAVDAVTFSLGAQSIGMGIFGSYNWIKADRSSILFSPLVIVVPVATLMSLVSIFIFPATTAVPLKVAFSIFGIMLAGYIFKHLDVDSDITSSKLVFDGKMILSLLGVGLVGGLLVGYIGVGVDTLLFVVLTFFFKVDSHKATVTSIVAMGLTAMIPFLAHLIVLKDVPLHLWLMVLPGIFLGAKLGPRINMALGQRRVLTVFSTVLVIEFLMTISKIIFSN